MIIGNGDIASVLREIDRKDRLFFVSGVSNSQETRESEYQREKDLLLSQRRDLKVIYCSSLGVLNGNTRYLRHKREMEELIKKFPKYTIVRLGNITWGDNPHTLINFMKARVAKGEKLEIRDEFRYIVDKDEFLYWIGLIPDWNCEISIIGRRMKVKDIVKEYVL